MQKLTGTREQTSARGCRADMMGMLSARAVVWLGVAAVAASGCARLDLSDTALLRCTTNEACPSTWRCASSIERCVPAGGDDLVGPQLLTSTLQVNDVALAAGSIVTAGASAVWHFTVDEDVFSAPTAVLVSDLDVASLPLVVVADDDGAGYSTTYRVSSDAGTAVLTPVVSLVDRVGNPSLVELLSLPVDTVAPVAAGITLTPADFAVDETVAVAIDARDDHAVTACIKAIDDDDTATATVAASCVDADFSTLARTVTLPDGNGEKRVVAVVRDVAGNVAAPIDARVVRLDGGVVDSAVTLTPPADQQQVKPGDTVHVAVVLTPGAVPSETLLLVDGVGRAITLGFASVASDRVEDTFVVPADVADGSTLELQVIVSYLGRESDAEQSRSTPVTVDAVAPAIDLATASLAVSETAVRIDVRQLRPDTIQHFLVDGDLDSGGGTVDFSPGIDVVLAASTESDTSTTSKTRTVRVRAVDRAGNESAEDELTFRLLPETAVGSLELHNGERQLIPGLKTRDPVVFGGTVVDAAAQLVAGSARLVYVDDNGSTLCTQEAPLGLQPSGFVGSARTTACSGATSVHLEAQIAFAGGAPTALSSTDLYIDNQPPTLTSLAFVPAGDQRNNTTNTTLVQVSIEASDAHNAKVAFSGDVEGTDRTPGEINGLQTFGVTVSSLNGGPIATRAIIAELEDDVGNRTLRVLNIVVDTVSPSAPRVGEARVVESAVAANDPQQTSTPKEVELVVQPSVVDNADRLLVLVDDDAVAVAPSEIRERDTRFTLPAGTQRVAFVSVDDAGNLSKVERSHVVEVPRLVVGALPAHPLGPALSTFTVTSSVTAGNLGVSLPAALSVKLGDAPATCLSNPDAVGTGVLCSVVVAPGKAPEGRIGDVGAAVIRVDLNAPRVQATSGTAVIVDTTPPVLSTDRAILDVVSVGRGAADVVDGAADAVVDFAGTTRLGDVFPPQIAVTSGTARNEDVAGADGSFAIAVGDFGDDVGVEEVIVTATDPAGNVSAPVTLTNDVARPGVAVTLSALRFRGGDTISVAIEVTDASAVARPQVAIGGAAAVVTPLSATEFNASLVVATPVVEGARSVVVDVVDGAGNTQRVVRSVTVDGVGPTISPSVAARTNQTRLQADVVEASGTVASVDVVVLDTGSNVPVFSGRLTRGAGNTFATTATGLVDGRSYTATFSAVDDVGNTSTARSAFAFDTSAPRLELTVDSGDPYRTQVPFSVGAPGDVDLATLECRIDSTRTDAFVPCSNPTFGVSATAVSVAPGLHRLAVRARDTAGNQSVSNEVPFTVRARRTLAGGDGVWCAINDDDNVMRCWGNQHGELDTAGVAGPVGPRLMARRWRKVAVRKGTICALDTADALFCWGDNTNARALREPPIAGGANVNAVAKVSLLAGQATAALNGTFLDVALFDEGGCVINNSRELQCWGNGLTTPFPQPQTQLQPVSVGPFDAVVAAGRVVCASTAAGEAACFGDSTRGELLTGTAQSGSIDDAIAGDVGDISTSGGHSCAIRRQDRLVHCAGNNSNGAVSGNETFGPATTPSLQTSQLGVALRVVAAGDRTCALGVDGRVRCQGQLAHGEVVGGGRIVQVQTLDGLYDDVTADDGTICGLERGTARVLCVGENGRGQIDLRGVASAAFGAGTALPSDVRRLSMVGHTVCAAVGNGQRFCMGDNPLNRWVVNNRAARFTSDVLTLVSTTNVGEDVLAMADDYACAATPNTFGNAGIACVGDAAAPLARQVATFDALEPVNPASLPFFSVRAIALADTFGCAAGDNQLACWGRLPTTGQTSVSPVTVSFAGPFGQVVDLAAGDSHVCQRTTSGVQCLGSNSASQLGSAGGNSTTLRSATTTQELNFDGGGFSSGRVAARGDTTCATTATGPVCWGANPGGLAGAGATRFGGPALAFPAVSVPRKVDRWNAQTNSCQANDVDVGRAVACATCSGGGIFCWGGGELVDNDPAFLRRIDDGGPSYTEVAVSDDGVVCAVQNGSTVRCFGDLSFGLSGTGNGFFETATEVVLP